MAWDDLTDNVMATCRDTFSTPVLYAPAGGTPFESEGIFDNEYRDVTMLDGALVQSSTPRLGMHRKDLQGTKAKVGDRVTVKGDEYRVIEFRPDGQAGAVLLLEKVKP